MRYGRYYWRQVMQAATELDPRLAFVATGYVKREGQDMLAKQKEAPPAYTGYARDVRLHKLYRLVNDLEAQAVVAKDETEKSALTQAMKAVQAAASVVRGPSPVAGFDH